MRNFIALLSALFLGSCSITNYQLTRMLDPCPYSRDGMTYVRYIAIQVDGDRNPDNDHSVPAVCPLKSNRNPTAVGWDSCIDKDRCQVGTCPQ